MNPTVPTPPAPDPMLLIAIVTKQNGVFLKVALKQDRWGNNVFTGDLSNCRVNGERPEKTRVDGWWKVTGYPETVTKVKDATKKTIGFVLSKGFSPSERMPERIDGVYTLTDGPYEGVCECYTPVYEDIPEVQESVLFQLHVIAEREKWFEPVRSDFTLIHGLIDQLTIADPVLLQERPCMLTGKQSYDLIRAHIKTNIDPKYAEITSDYDFCLTVQKRIEMAEPEAYKRVVKIGKRSSEVTDYRRYRMVQCFEVAPPGNTGKPYQGYTLVTPFRGSSYEDLQTQIAEYLSALMKRINEPLCECKACGGKGVVIETLQPVVKPA